MEYKIKIADEDGNVQQCNIPPFKYVLGVDTYDEKVLAYILLRSNSGVIQVIHTKIMRDKKEFEQEVENLSKYFNADVVRFI